MAEGNDILIACTIGDLAWLKRSLAAGSRNVIAELRLDESLRNSEGLGPVHLAAKNCKVNVVEYLLTHCAMEADTQAQPSGDTALHCALSRAAYRTAVADNTRCVKMLISKGASCNRQNNSGSTPLHYAAKGGYATVLRILLSHGANIYIKDNEGKTAYDLACLHGHYKCARLLKALLWADTKDKMKEHEFHVQKREQSPRPQHVKESAMERCCTPSESMSEPPIAHLESHQATTSATGHHKAAGSRNLLQVAKTKISLHQAERNISRVGKPDKMYPYTNYPPARLRQHSSLICRSNSLPVSTEISPGVKVRLVQSARSKFGSNTSSRPHSSQSLKSKSLPSTHHSHGKGMPHCSKNIPAKGIQSHHESPNSSSDANHCSLSHHAQPRIGMNVINLENVDLPPDNIVCQHDDGPPNESGSEESENGGSTSSIDGFMFHDVGQVNDLQSLSITTPSSCLPAITPAELLQMLRLTSASETGKRPVRRASSYSHRANRGRPNFNRGFSLGAIPEGEMVTHYPEEQAEGSLVFDEEFLYTIMPFAFQGMESYTANNNSQPHTGLAETRLPFTSSISQQPSIHSSSASISSSQGSRSEATEHSKNASPGPLTIVTMAWESESHVDTTDDRPVSPRTGQPRLPLSPTGLEPITNYSPPPSPSHIAPLPVNTQTGFRSTADKESRSPSKEISCQLAPQTSHHLETRGRLLQRRAKSAPQKRTVPQHKQILKSTLFEFGGGLRHY